jgi:hypothetical protein
LRAIRDERLENISFSALVDRGPVYWDANRRLSLDSKTLLAAVRNSQRLGASDRDIKWALDTVDRAERVWDERYRGGRVQDSAPSTEPVVWGGVGTGSYDHASEVARNEQQKAQLAAHWANRRLL